MDVLRARAFLDLLLGKDSRPRPGHPRRGRRPGQARTGQARAARGRAARARRRPRRAGGAARPGSPGGLP